MTRMQVALIAGQMGASLWACSGDVPIEAADVVPLGLSADTAIGMINRIAVAGCLVALYDHPNRRVHLVEDGVRRLSFGRSGAGPGEIGHVMALALDSVGNVYAIDWGRRRLLRWTSDGENRGDVALRHGPFGHLAVGPIAIYREHDVVDYMLGGHVSGIALSMANVDTMPLLHVIDSTGVVTRTFGYLDAPQDSIALALRSLLQIGSLVVNGDSIFVLRYQQPRLEVYVGDEGRAPVLSITLRRGRKMATPSERTGTVHERGFISGSQVQLNEAAAGFSRDAAGRIYVLMLGDPGRTEPRRASSPWPPEALWVFDSNGVLLKRLSLPTRNTRGLAVASDGSVLVLSHPTAAADEAWDVVRIPPLDGRAGNGMSCRWTN